MPLYELFALSRAGVPKAQLADIIRTLGKQVMDQGGVVTAITSYGERRLAYDIRRPGERHAEVRGGSGRARERAGTTPALGHVHAPPLPPTLPPAPSLQTLPPLCPPPSSTSQAGMWQINFAASPTTLADLDHTLRVDERLLRWMVLKRRAYPALPTPHAVARAAEHVAAPLAKQQEKAAAAAAQREMLKKAKESAAARAAASSAQ